MMKKMNKLLMLTLLLPTLALAQGGAMGEGGGNITEADLQHYIGKIGAYLSTDEGRKAFPEIIAYDQLHPEQSFTQMIKTVSPVVQNQEQKDALGIVRTCVSHVSPTRYFACDSNALPDKTLDNQPSFYRIVFHELLVQAGIEKPLGMNVPSEYKISWRITENVHLETYQEWVPGKNKNSFPGVECEISEFYDHQNVKRRVMIQAHASAARLLISEQDKKGNFTTEEYPLEIAKAFLSPDHQYRTFDLSIATKDGKLALNSGVIIGSSSYLYGNFPDKNYSSTWPVGHCSAIDFDDAQFKHFLSPSVQHSYSYEQRDEMFNRSIKWLKTIGE